jgi:hypothetical protein
MSVGFVVTQNGEWAPYYAGTHQWGSFYNDALQGYLLGYFTVNGVRVDPYDGGEFRGDQLDILLRQLESAVVEVSAKSPEWPFYDEKQRSRYYEVCRIYDIEPQPPRDQALRTLREAIKLARSARSANEALVFVGD